MDQSNKSFDVKLSGESILTGNIPVEAKSISINRSGGALPIYMNIVQNGFDREKSVKEIENGMELKRYYVVNGKESDSFVVGDEIEVRVLARSLKGTLSNMAIVDLLPGGTELQLDSLPSQIVSAGDSHSSPYEDEIQREEGDVEGGMPEEGSGEGDFGSIFDRLLGVTKAFAGPNFGSISNFRFENIDAREDRVVVYGSLLDEVTQIFYKIRATASGTFYVPPTYAKSMYIEDKIFRGKGGSITIKAR
ncbi:MAG: hypothetical protein NT027_12420 [Proteobacteria bacterium]|nr:hypothetical protein [Pseudomonadota bacterium]